MVTEKMIEAFWSKVTVTKEGSIVGLENGLEAALSTDADPVAWLDDGLLRAGSTGTSYRVVTAETKADMPTASSQNFNTPLYAVSPAPSVAVKALCSSPLIESLTPTTEDWDRCETIQDRYDLMKRLIRSALSAQVQDVDDRAAINLGASVLSKIADPAAREVAIRNALTAALNRDLQAKEVEILAGWQLVPKEATSEMMLAGQERRNAKRLFDMNDAFHVYRAMLAAAPAAKQGGLPNG